jgi:glycosyltransferase involved in cell wall biosynthesis
MEGMSLTDGVNILVEDGAEAFAMAIAKLYENETLWNAISRAGLEFADKTWGREIAWKTLANILDDLKIKVERGYRPLKLYSSEKR